MANNCLVTKLKGSVQNDNLPVLGTGIMEVDVRNIGSGAAIIHYTGKGPIVFEIIEGNVSSVTYPQHLSFMRKEGNKIYVDLDGTYDSKSSTFFPLQITATGAYKIRFNKYNCRPNINAASTNYKLGVRISVDDLKYLDSTLGKYSDYNNTIILGKGVLGDAVKLYDSAFTQMHATTHDGNIMDSLIEGNISELLNISNLTAIYCTVALGLTGYLATLTTHQNKANITTIVFSNCPNVSGDLNTVLPQFPALTEFGGENGPGFTGNLDTIATNFIAAGRQAGTSLRIAGNMSSVVPNPTAAGKTINFISDGQGGVTYEIV